MLRIPNKSIISSIYNTERLFILTISIFLLSLLFCFLSFYHIENIAGITTAIIISSMILALFFYVCRPKLVFKCHFLIKKYHRKFFCMMFGFYPVMETEQSPSLTGSMSDENELIIKMISNGFSTNDVIFLQLAKEKNLSMLHQLQLLNKSRYQIIAPFLVSLIICFFLFLFTEGISGLEPISIGITV